MAARHKKRASGGIAIAGGNPHVLEEAKEKRKDGGAVTEPKTVGRMHGGLTRHRLDRPGRKMGGRVGADKSPLSSAATASAAPSMPKSNSSK